MSSSTSTITSSNNDEDHQLDLQSIPDLRFEQVFLKSFNELNELSFFNVFKLIFIDQV